MGHGDIWAFGPFQFDSRTKRLTRAADPVALSARQADLLALLIARAGQILTKDVLIDAAWQGVAVTDNSLEQAISGLRRVLAPAPGPYIETLARRGYRFSAEVVRVDRRETDEALDALLAPHRAWIEGRAALETLAQDGILRARSVFEGVLAHVPHQASAHVGLANACVLQFETTRCDPAPDVSSLSTAQHHATEACRLDPEYGEAWATLGFVLDRTGHHADALAASRRAVALEPDNWRHRLRLSYVSWGEERLREARRTLALLPGFPLAHWLAASVYVARQALSAAERELRTGLAAQVDVHVNARFSAVALHWLLGLIRAAQGDERDALQEFDRELAEERSGHLYARECAGNTWYAIGAIRLRRADTEGARTAFECAMARVPQHPLAGLGLAAATGMVSRLAIDGSMAPPAQAGRTVDAALYRAIGCVLAGATADAASIVNDALGSAPPGSAGWLLPVEPILRAVADAETWGSALSRLAHRAA